jgi:lipopolysaccharide biosynthesis protein
MPFPKLLKDIYWALPFLTEKQKDTIFYKLKQLLQHNGVKSIHYQSNLFSDYIHQILEIPTAVSRDFKTITNEPYQRNLNDPKLIAYYLPQMHPTPENDAWWGRGVTEWNNVSRAVPQFVGHYQPRLPGELGFYDLRLKENLKRQIELAKMYGIYGFSWYYYWFDGKRLLDKPLDMFLHDSSLDFPFCLCWANESWTKGFFGSSKEIIMKQSTTEDSYRDFIKDAIKYLKDNRYIEIQGKKVLIVYKPHSVPNSKQILNYWREYCKENGVKGLYIIGCWTGNEKNDILELGFDAEAEFQPGSLYPYNDKINSTIPFVNTKFVGDIYSYQKIVEEKIYSKNFLKEKMYNAVMPMWDNTPRRNSRGNVIFHGSSPALYKKWLRDIIKHYRNDCVLDDNIIFINAWNEWGEGAYLEPDRYYGYAYLEATKNAIEEERL